MAINKNHEFGDLDGERCAIVEKDVPPERVQFLRDLLETNGYTVKVVASPPPKTPAAAKPDAASEPATPPPPVAPETFIVGVTDVTFNAVNAIFGRNLKTKNGHIVTLAYWNQQDAVSHDEIPYYQQNP